MSERVSALSGRVQAEHAQAQVPPAKDPCGEPASHPLSLPRNRKTADQGSNMVPGLDLRCSSDQPSLFRKIYF